MKPITKDQKSKKGKTGKKTKKPEETKKPKGTMKRLDWYKEFVKIETTDFDDF